MTHPISEGLPPIASRGMKRPREEEVGRARGREVRPRLTTIPKEAAIIIERLGSGEDTVSPEVAKESFREFKNMCREGIDIGLAKDLVHLLRERHILTAENEAPLIKQAVKQNNLDLLACLIREGAHPPDSLKEYAVQHKKQLGAMVEYIGDTRGFTHVANFLRELVASQPSRKRGRPEEEVPSEHVAKKAARGAALDPQVRALVKDLRAGAPVNSKAAAQVLKELCLHHPRDAITGECIDLLRQENVLTDEEMMPFIGLALELEDLQLLSRFVQEEMQVSSALRKYIHQNSHLLVEAAAKNDSASQKVALFLLTNGADAGCVNAFGKNALFWACTNGNGPLIKALVSQDAASAKAQCMHIWENEPIRHVLGTFFERPHAQDKALQNALTTALDPAMLKQIQAMHEEVTTAFLSNPEAVSHILARMAPADIGSVAQVSRALPPTVGSPIHATFLLSNAIANNAPLDSQLIARYQKGAQFSGKTLTFEQALQECLTLWRQQTKGPLHVKLANNELTSEIMNIVKDAGVEKLTLDMGRVEHLTNGQTLSDILLQIPTLRDLELKNSSLAETIDLARFPRISKLNMQNCSGLQILLSPGNALETLVMDSCTLQTPSFLHANSLRVLQLRRCLEMNAPLVIPKKNALQQVVISECFLPTPDFLEAAHLTSLRLLSCPRMNAALVMPIKSPLQQVVISDCPLPTPDFSEAVNLTSLRLLSCPKMNAPLLFSSKNVLDEIELEASPLPSLDFNHMKDLRVCQITACNTIPTYVLPEENRLEVLGINYCGNIESIDLSNGRKLRKVELSGVYPAGPQHERRMLKIPLPEENVLEELVMDEQIHDIDLSCADSLRVLVLGGENGMAVWSTCSTKRALQKLVFSGDSDALSLDLSQDHTLAVLELSYCNKLEELHLPKHLRELTLKDCPHLPFSSHLTTSPTLLKLTVAGIKRTREPLIFPENTSIKRLEIRGIPTPLVDLTHAETLESLEIDREGAGQNFRIQLPSNHRLKQVQRGVWKAQ